MKSRRTFLKILAGLGGFLLPWTVLPSLWGQTLDNILGKPPVKLSLPLGNDNFKNDGFTKPPEQVLDRKAIEDIEALTHHHLQGRRAGTAGETRALVYLEEQLRSLSLKAYGRHNYWQLFSIPAMKEKIINGRALFRQDETDSLRMPAANILAGIEGRSQEKSLIISAHYDHLGIYNGVLFPGANDNASGVGCVLQVMRRLVREYFLGSHPKINVIAAFWGAEEMGFLGSKHFVKEPTIPLSELKAVINIDTVGNGEKMDFIFWSSGNDDLNDLVKKAAIRNGATAEKAFSQSNHSDEVAFVHTAVPAVTLLSKDWLNKNHTSNDNISLLNEEKLDTVCSVLYDMVKEIAY